jgi:DNA-binding response OmpR family regulator
MRLLVVEDDDLLRNSLCKGLAEAGYAVDATGDGQEGLWFARTNGYDVIVLDIMLPGIDGLSILSALRQEHSKAQVLLLTARDAVEDRVTGLDRGADDYLVKPFAFDELLARIRAMLRHAYDSSDPIIRISDLVLDTSKRTVCRGDKAIQLTAREYALLEYLARRSGEVVSRTDIWEHLYDFQDESTSNVVDVYILYLRRKLEDGGRPRLIHTRRGLGYVLGEPN